MSSLEPVPAVRVVGAPITAISFADHVERIVAWARLRESRVVCVANVHMVMEARRSPEFAEILERADLVTPDGMPLVWVMRRVGDGAQERVAGMDLMPAVFLAAGDAGIKVFLLGSEAPVLDRIIQRIARETPSLDIVGAESPPFRPLTAEEDEALVSRINQSGAGVVFVALGCPKQECWMKAHQDRVQAVMIGVGAAFPVYASVEPRAPGWMRRAGLEWLFRLCREPRRLWRRYWETNAPFLVLATRQCLLDGRGRRQDISRIPPS